MSTIDQHIALSAQEAALVPGAALLDGRTEIDRLAFLSDFASLINFYDHDNNLHGNWMPFLLKDPAILLAHISKTNLGQIHAAYQNNCNQIRPLVFSNRISKDLVIGMDHLLDLLTKLFIKLERWTHYMQVTQIDYELKKYLLHQVKTVYSRNFWALLSLRDHLSILPYRYKIKPAYDYLYDNFDAYIWKENKNKSPYWEVLGLPHQVDSDVSASAIYQSVKNVGDQLLNFLDAIVSFAAEEYDTVKAINGKYPDTLLIRAFVSLLNNYTVQLNGLAGQHLDFYYQDILKQTVQGANSDQALIFATLAKPDAAFTLSKGALFNGGMDAQKNPILLESLGNTCLNPAVLNNAYTIGKIPGSNNLTGIQKIANPDVVKKDEEGKVQSWPFFGNQSTTPGTTTGFSGFLIASPLLYLKDGNRTIMISFQNASTTLDLTMVKFYLSTSAGWFMVNPKAVKLGNNQGILTLAPTDPGIVPFLVNTEKLDNTWPTLKMEFAQTESLTKMMHAFSGINLSVGVTAFRALQLYNDYGAISAKNPYQPFGPIPLLNSSFIVGSEEIFSKPVSTFGFEIQWANLPHNFKDQYDIYNQYLTGELMNLPMPGKLVNVPLFQKFKNLVMGSNATTNLVWIPFNNLSFSSQFMLLQNGSWEPLDMTVPHQTGMAAETPETIAAAASTGAPQFLFVQDNNELLQPQSEFSLQEDQNAAVASASPIQADPNLQINTPLKYTAASASGFMKMVLSGNQYGFGSDLYPKVVAQVATYNSWVLYNKPHELQSCKPVPNPPFSPRISDLQAYYTAETNLDTESAYPFSIEVYSPLTTKSFTPAIAQSLDLTAETVSASLSTAPFSTNDLLFSTSNSGFLFLEMDQLAPAEAMSIYFELTTDQSLASTIKKVTYYYLNENGWALLDVLSDGTANFNCSGLVQIAVPKTITPQAFIGEDKRFWIGLVADVSAGPFPSVVSIKTNGLWVQRCSGIPFTGNLASASISKPQNPIPQISTITQPFPSFGGLPAENSEQMKQRVSLRLKTKDRAVSAEDYYRLIVKAYPTVFYSKTVFNPVSKTNQVFVVPAYADWREANAFNPRLNPEMLNGIATFLSDRTGGLTGLEVNNFNQLPICISANIQIQTGYTCEGVKKSINQALNLYLSPWIAGDQPKVSIGAAIENVQLATLIQHIEGVANVTDVDYHYTGSTADTQQAILIVSGMNHILNCSY